MFVFNLTNRLSMKLQQSNSSYLSPLESVKVLDIDTKLFIAVLLSIAHMQCKAHFKEP